MTTPNQNTEDNYTWCERCGGHHNNGKPLCNSCYEDAAPRETDDEIDTLVAT